MNYSTFPILFFPFFCRWVPPLLVFFSNQFGEVKPFNDCLSLTRNFSSFVNLYQRHGVAEERSPSSFPISCFLLFLSLPLLSLLLLCSKNNDYQNPQRTMSFSFMSKMQRDSKRSQWVAICRLWYLINLFSLPRILTFHPQESPRAVRNS